MQITDEAVEAAAREFYRALSFDSVGPPVRDRWMASARAALEAALPHLLASQGCGTGHSGSREEPTVSATAALARHEDVRENWELTDEFGWATPAEVEQAIASLSQNNGDLAYKIQGCFARGGAFAAPVDGDGNLAACAREAGWALSENVDRLPWERRGRIAANIQKLGAALLVYPDDGGEAVHTGPLSDARAEPQNNLPAHPTKGGEA